jgi:hypothetical protein
MLWYLLVGHMSVQIDEQCKLNKLKLNFRKLSEDFTGLHSG